jgi:hypothetical protein
MVSPSEAQTKRGETVLWDSQRLLVPMSRLNRHRANGEQSQAFAQKLRGHYAYQGGVVGNRKWLSRRKRRGQFSWERLNPLLKVFQLPQPTQRVTPCAASP